MHEFLEDNLYNRIHRFVNNRMGLFFTEKRKNDLIRGLSLATETFGYRDLETCIRQLLSVEWTQKEIETLASYLTVGETYFYRHREQIDYLINVFIRERNKTGNKSLRIWSAACCSGEEPYTLAMLLKENIKGIEGWDIRIFGTDINPVFLRKAKQGIYTEHSFRKFPDVLKAKYFTQVNKNQFEIDDGIKKMVEFSYLNLASNTYPSDLNGTINLDVILCRNVFIYFHQDTIDKVVSRFKNSLTDNGLFIVSPAETFMVPVSIMHKAPFSNPIVFLKPSIHSIPQNKPRRRIELKEEFPGPEWIPRIIKPTQILGHKLTVTVSKPESKQVRVLQEKRIPENVRETYNTLFEIGKYDQAIEYINKIKIEDFALEDQKSAMTILCKISSNTGSLEEALKISEKIVEIDKLDPKSYFLHASVLLEKGRMQDAVNELNKALYLDQSFILAHYLLGNILRSMDMYNTSNKHMLNAVSYLKRLPPDNILEQSEGLTAGKLTEIIRTILKAEGIEI